MNGIARSLLAFLPLILGCTSAGSTKTVERLDTDRNGAASSSSILSPETPSVADLQATSDETLSDNFAAENFASNDNNSPTPEHKLPAMRSIDEMMIFFPSKYPNGNWQPTGITFEDVWITTDDQQRIHGWYCPCDQPRAVVLYAHGNAGNLTHRAPLISLLQNELRVSVLIFDYRGYGRSDGLATAKGILRDARAARDLLAERAGVTASDVVLMGRSLGGAVAVQLAVESPPRGLILESTFSSLKDLALVHYPKLAWLVSSSKLNSSDLIGSYQGPLLQSHGDADQTIPYSLGQKLFAAANEPKLFVTISQGDHNDPQTVEYYQQLDHFIDALAEDRP